MQIFADFWAKNGPRRPPRGPPCNAVNTKTLSFWCTVMMVTKNLDNVSKKKVSGQKTAFWARKSVFFYATPIEPLFFGLRRTRLHGIISPPYPEATFDTFGFLVGGHLAARRTVLWLRLPKVAFFGVENAVFRPETHFLETSAKKRVTIMTGHQKDNVFVLVMLLGKLLGGCNGPFLARKSDFFTLHP